MYKDLRDFLKAVENHGELKKISGAHWDLEMGSITELVNREGVQPKPAILFDDIPDYPKGYRTLFGQTTSLWRIATMLGLPQDQLDRQTLVRNWSKKATGLRPIPPMFVESGPVFENVDVGDKVDILKFPSPRHHEGDTQRYIGTASLVIERDPDNGWVNLGTYRVMVVDRNTLALHITEGKHGNKIMREKYFARGQTMPIAIALGTSPTLYQVGGIKLLWGSSEYDYAGGLMGEPIEVIKGKYTGLPIPAYAEIVIEGEVRPDDLVDEGPFGESFGYFANLGYATVPEPAIRIKAVYYRNNPILVSEHPSVPPHSHTLVSAVFKSGDILHKLEELGISGIKGVWCHELGNSNLFNVVSLQQLYVGHSREVGVIVSQIPHEGRYTIVVDEDIDPTNLEEVMWAVSTRVMPEDSIHIIDHCRAGSQDTAVPLAEKLKYKTPPKPLFGSRAVIDACQNLAYKKDWYPVAKVSPELRTKILNKWQSHFSDVLKNTR